MPASGSSSGTNANTNSGTATRSQRLLDQTAWVGGSILGAVFLGFLALVALRLNVDYWDTYDYLSNALLIAGKNVGVEYNVIRPPLVSFINVIPLFFYEPGSRFTNTVPHLIAFGLSLCALAALFWLLRQQFDKGDALFGVILLMLNPLFVHYSVFLLTDIPGMLFLSIFFVSYYKQNYRLAAVALLLAILTRYTNLLAIGSLIVFEVITGGWRSALSLRRLKPFVVAAVVFYLVHLPIFLATIRPLWKSALYLLAVFRGLVVAGRQEGFVDPIAEYPVELLTAFTIPIVLLAAFGVFRSVSRRNRLDLLMLSWFFVMFFFVSAATHKEARYLLSMFPAFFYFVIAAVDWMSKRTQSYALRAAVIGLPLAIVAVIGVRELNRFNDPVYTQPFLREVTSAINNQAKPQENIYWSGMGLYNSYPRNHYLFPHDEFIYFHHLNSTGLAFLLGRPVQRLPKDAQVTDGVVVTTNNRMYANMKSFEAPEPPPPLTITFFENGTVRQVLSFRYR